jgi:AcrR family transcriptional regulator
MENEGKIEFSEKQIQIIVSTERLFAEKGYEGTSVRDIALAAGVNVAMISYYFGSKEKLFEAIFAHRISLSKLQLESLVQDKTLTSIQKMFHLIDTYVAKIMDNPHFHRISVQAYQSREMKDVAMLIHDNKMRNIDLVKKIIHEGQRNKEFVKGIDVPMLIITLLGTAYQMINNVNFYRLIYKLEALSDAEVHLHLKKKLTTHLKNLFKATLTYESK